MNAKDYTGHLNQCSMLTGYTDALIGPAQWPSISMGWQVVTTEDGSKPMLQIQFSFDTSRYDQSNTVLWQDNASKDLKVYTRLFYQIADPNSIAYIIETSLLKNSVSPNPYELHDWLFYGNSDSSICKFLKNRADGKTDVRAPDGKKTIKQPIESSIVNEDQIFELNLSLSIKRTGGIVQGGFMTVSGVKQITATVTPLLQYIDRGSNDGSCKLGLTQFAKNFQDTLSEPGSFLLKVATGVNCTAISNIQYGYTLWAVRIGMKRGQGIWCNINNKSAPAIFAPRPISNKLESSEYVPIYDYTSGTGISPDPTRMLTFVNIDMDLWGRQFLSAVDSALKPEYTAAIQIVDRFKSMDYFRQVLDLQKNLAEIIRKWLIAFYQENNVDDPTIVQEVFYKQLLSRLSNAYSTRAAIQFDAEVDVHIKDPIDLKAPCLTGTVVQKTTDLGNSSHDSNLILTSPKLKLETASAQPIPFLLTSPEIVKSKDGAVLPNITMDLVFNGSFIEHQIGYIPGIHSYEASSWLDFVIEEDDNHLSSDLGTFIVPLVLRSYPVIPTMAVQSGHTSITNATELSELTLWDYSFTYALPYHYPQDRIDCRVDFNIAETMLKLDAMNGAFNQLAQFIRVFPAVNKDFEEMVVGIDSNTTDLENIDKAAVALESFIKMVKDVADELGEKGLTMHENSNAFFSSGVPSYNFSIREKSLKIDNVEALISIINGKPPQGINPPQVLIEPENYELQSCSDAGEGDFCYWYKSKKDGSPLSAADGQSKKERTVVLQKMDILQRQNAWSAISIRRNEELVPGKKTAEPFVYVSPEVTFSNPLHMTIDIGAEVDIAKIGSSDNKPITKTLEAHLQALFAELLKNNQESRLTLQVEVTYRYSINNDLSAIILPVFMQLPIVVNVKDNNDADWKLGQMIIDWTNSIELWINTHKPSLINGVLMFNLFIISNLNKQPIPIIRLRKLNLPMQYVK